MNVFVNAMKIQRALLIASAASVLTFAARFITIQHQTHFSFENSSHSNNERQLSIWHLFSDLFRGIKTRQVTVDGTRRKFLEIGRHRFESGSPAVIVLHGRLGSMRQLIHQKATKVWLQRQKEEGFLLLVPNGLDKRWNELRQPDLTNPNDVAFLTAVADHAVQAGADKIFLSGISNGGLMSYTMAVEEPGLFTAVAVFIANMPDPLPPIATPVPMFIMLGTDDPLMKQEGGEVVEDNDFEKPVSSAAATVDYWIQSNNAAAVPSINMTLPDDDPTDDSCTIRSLFYEPNDPSSPSTSAPVHYYVMEGGGHVVPLLGRTKIGRLGLVGPPCGDANGVDLVWDFFREYL